MISAKIAESKSKCPPWTDWLPHIVCKYTAMSIYIISYHTYCYVVLLCNFLLDTLNTQVHEATKHTPYELVFEQPPRSLLVPDVTFKGKINEEDLSEPGQEEEEDNDNLEQDIHRQEEQDDYN